MEFTPTPVFYVIVGFLIGIIIGWVVGFFDSNGRASKKIKAAESNAELKIAEAEKKIAEAEQKLALVPPPSQIQQDDPGLLRLKNSDGRLTVEMDGALITGELSADKRKRLIELITVVRPLLEGGQVPQAAPKQAASSQVVPPQPIPAPRSPEPELPQVVVAPAPSSVLGPIMQPITQAVTKKPADTEKNIKALSMVQQIDTVLQERLLGTSLAKQGIRLQESIQGGVEVYVGLQKFHAVDDVPDETIKAAIRAAIAEWEKKFTPGL